MAAALVHSWTQVCQRFQGSCCRAAVLMGLGLPYNTGMSLDEDRMPVTPAQGCLDEGVQDPYPKNGIFGREEDYSPQHATPSAGAQYSMPGPVVLLPSKNAILDFFWAGCSPIFCSSKHLPGSGLAG